MIRTEEPNIEAIQQAVRDEGVDGWLLYDFRDLDPLAGRILHLDASRIRTRRWFYLVPAKGEPTKLVHRIEPGSLDPLPGRKIIYLSYGELRKGLKEMLSGCSTVAMQYSPENNIPYVSRVDAGTVELVQAAGPRVASSAGLVQAFEAVLTPELLDSHIRAAEALRRIVDRTFAWIGERTLSGDGTDEYAVQRRIYEEFDREGLVTDEEPICAVNANASDPHYGPKPDRFDAITRGDLVLVDIFAKLAGADAIYADITWMGYVGASVPEPMARIFEIAAGARDRGVSLLEERFAAGLDVYGWEVDDVVRGHIRDAGHGDAFIHRTGHSIGRECHGNGANIDNLETRDDRRLVPGLVFSIEPGIYLEEFGIRTEIDVYIDDEGVKVSGLPVQMEIVKILP